MPERFFVPQLDGLRFLAFVMVFYVHSAAERSSPWFHGTWLTGSFGVDLFFVLSSFLITSLLLREQDARGGYLDVKSFWIRRALRIWPLYFAFVAGSAIVEQLPGWYVLGLETFTLNWLTAFSYAVPSWTLILWSVSMEEQFYLVWPLIVRFVSRDRLPWMCVGMIAFSVGARAILIGTVSDWSTAATARQSHYMLWNFTLTRLDPLAVGALVAWLWRVRPWTVAIPTPIGILGLLAAVVMLQRYFPVDQPGWHQVWIYLAVAIVLGGVVAITFARSTSILTLPAMVYLGQISYGLYVFHIFAAVTVAHVAGSIWWPIRLPLTFGVTLACAALSYRWLEQPFLQFKARFTHIPSSPIYGATQTQGFSVHRRRPSLSQ
jgi:peptidoglycan/LPS O-acetylase OafA/YrhL